LFCIYIWKQIGLNLQNSYKNQVKLTEPFDIAVDSRADEHNTFPFNLETIRKLLEIS
jgi:hypothetical protein